VTRGVCSWQLRRLIHRLFVLTNMKRHLFLLLVSAFFVTSNLFDTVESKYRGKKRNGRPSTPEMNEGGDGPAGSDDPGAQEAKYREYERRRKKQEAEDKEIDQFTESVIDKILHVDVPEGYVPPKMDWQRGPTEGAEADDDMDEEENHHPKQNKASDGGFGGSQKPKGITLKEQLRQIYKAHNPSKLKDIPKMLDKYKGREKLLMQKVMKKYMPFVKKSGERRESTERSRQQARRARSNKMPGMPPPSDSKEILDLSDTYVALLFELYSFVDKDKLENRTFIPLLLKKYEKSEDVLVEAILQKYFTESLYAWKFGAVLGTEENDAEAFAHQLVSLYEIVNPEKIDKVPGIVEKFSDMKIQRKVVGAILEKYMPELNEWMARGVTVAVSDQPPKSQYDIPNWMRAKMGGMSQGGQ
jgi:hypothetical protein